jgi:hypothetical protein
MRFVTVRCRFNDLEGWIGILTVLHARGAANLPSCLPLCFPYRPSRKNFPWATRFYGATVAAPGLIFADPAQGEFLPCLAESAFERRFRNGLTR